MTYYLVDKGNKEAYHKGICPAGSEVKAEVTGKVAKKGEKMVITDAKVKVLE